MSVPKSKQYESNYLVVERACDIYEKIVDMCVKMPKRYKEYISKELVDLARKIRSNVVQGNSIRLNKSTLYYDFISRHKKFIEAYAALDDLSVLIKLSIKRPLGLRAYDSKSQSTKGVTTKELEAVSDLISIEYSLLKGAIKADINKMIEINPNWKDTINDPFYN